MSSLRVENRILKYKGITYQISQISSIKIVEIKRKIEERVSLKPLKFLASAIIISGLISWLLLANANYYGLLAGAASLLCCYFVFNLLKRKLKEAAAPKFRMLYGLSMRMSNGDDPIFISNDRSVMFDVRNAIYDAMNNNHENASVSFDNVNIEITDSNKVEIGNVVGG